MRGAATLVAGASLIALASGCAATEADVPTVAGSSAQSEYEANLEAARSEKLAAQNAYNDNVSLTNELKRVCLDGGCADQLSQMSKNWHIIADWVPKMLSDYLYTSWVADYNEYQDIGCDQVRYKSGCTQQMLRIIFNSNNVLRGIREDVE